MFTFLSNRFKYIFILVFLITQLMNLKLYSKSTTSKTSDTTNSINRLLQKLSNSGKKDNRNYVFLEVNYGFTNPSFYSNDISINGVSENINNKLDKLNSLDIKYGFYHEDRKIKLNDFFKFTNEYIQFGNKSSYMNIFEKTLNEYTQESWVAHLGSTNGYGIKDVNLPILGSFEVLLAHSMAIDLNRIDIEQVSTIVEYQSIFNNYDEKYKFGNSFSSSVILKTKYNINLRLGYEDRLVFVDFPFFKWGGSYLMDNILLKLPEVYEEELISEFGNYYPYLLFGYQTLYSLGSYYLKEQNSYFPFNSETPLRYRGVIIGISIIIDN